VSSSPETHGDGAHADAVATASKSSIDDANKVLASLTPQLIHNGDDSKNQGPLRQRHQQQQRHCHLQHLVESDWTQIGSTY
jgi:hypothetical protein